MNTSNFTTVFRKFFIWHIIILLIPIVTGLISYQVSVDTARQNALESGLSVLNQSRTILDRRMFEVEGFTRQLAVDPDLSGLLSRSIQQDEVDIFGLWKLSRDISGYARTNDFLEDFYIYISSYDAIVTPGSVFFRSQHYYNMNQYSNLSHAEWKQAILQISNQRRVIPSQTYVRNVRHATPVITYAQSLPLNAVEKPGGSVVVVIDSWKISDLLNSISQQYGGWAFVTDEGGNMLATVGITEDEAIEIQSLAGGADQTFLNDQTLLIRTRSDSIGWSYVAGIPRESLMREADKIKMITLSVTAISLLIGLAVSMISAYRHSRPINRLIELVSEHGGDDRLRGKGSEYDFIQGNIYTLINSNQSLEQELEQQRAVIKDAFLKRLLNGEIHSGSAIAAAAEQAGVVLPYEQGYVAILEITGYGELESAEIYNELYAARLLVKQMLRETAPEIELTDRHADKVSLLIMCSSVKPNTRHSELQAKLARLQSDLSSKYRISLQIAVGGLFDKWADISRSYEEAQQTLEFMLLTRTQSTCWHFETRVEKEMYYFTLDMELRLMNVMKLGETEEGLRLIDQIFKVNFQERELSPDMANQLIGELKAALLKTFEVKYFANKEQADLLRNEVLRIQLHDGLDAVQAAVVRAVTAYGQIVSQRKRELDDETVNEMISFLVAHHQEADLTLNKMAEHLDRPEKFVSQLFKEHTGTYISEYLENFRIQRASELLLQTEDTIESISHQVGYNSPHSFRRAFKRLTGMTPNQYRSTMIES